MCLDLRLGVLALGSNNPVQMLKLFFVHGDGRAYPGVSAGKSLGVLIGFVPDILPVLSSYFGIRSQLGDWKLLAFWWLFLIAILVEFVSTCVFHVLKNWSRTRPLRRAPLRLWRSGLD